jgi:hypothetical protein
VPTEAGREGIDSNEENTIREDMSGALGCSIGQVGSPSYCLNGRKFSLSGWIDEKKKVVSGQHLLDRS